MSWEVWVIMLKTSLFNKGIYKSNLTRFKWGSFLYFVLLFFSTSFILLMRETDTFSPSRTAAYLEAGGFILDSELLTFPILLASFVPTVVAFLVFDMFSSKKQSIFIHSLPCGRVSVYISTVLAAFTLMAAPVIANGIILMLISVFKWSSIYTVASCFKWILINLVLLFVMFSVSVFSAGITSSKPALLFINAFLHILPLIVTFGITGVAAVYLYGFDSTSDSFFKSVLSWMPAFSHLVNADNSIGAYSLAENLLSKKSLIFAICAVFVYAVSLLLYKKRNIETAGSFFTFKILNPILKYTLTALATVCTFILLMDERNLYMVILLIAVSLIIYFASEMVLKKNLKVFSAYRGYLVFAAAMLALNTFMQFTGAFGYETRVPDADKVESVCIADNWRYEASYTNDSEVIDEAIASHKSIIKSIPSVLNNDRNNYNNLFIKYKLKNGSELTRSYCDLSDEKHDSIMTALYGHIAYRRTTNSLKDLNPDESGLDFLRIRFRLSDEYGYSFSVNGKNNIREFLSAWNRDIDALSYKERYSLRTLADVTLVYGEEYYKKNYASEINSVDFNSSYKNVLNYLEENGYFDGLSSVSDYKCYISKTTHTLETKPDENGDKYTYFDGEKDYAYRLDFDAVAPVRDEDTKLLFSSFLSDELERSYDDGEYYSVYIMNTGTDELENYTLFATFTKDSLPDYMAEYVD